MPSRWKSYLEIMAMRKDERGQGLVEYALIIMLVAVALAGALLIFGGDLSDIYNEITGQIP